MQVAAEARRVARSTRRGLPFLLALALVAGCGTSTETKTVAMPVTKQGRLLWQFEAPLHDTFGNGAVCASGRWAQRFTSGGCKPLAVYSPYFYVFRGARHSRFHITSKSAIGFGNYPQPVLIRSRNVACNNEETTFLIKYVDGAGLSLGCSRAGVVSG